MKLQHIELSKLTLSPLNVRKHGGEDVGDLVASIRSLGIIQPLLVRQNGEGFEVVAGQRRLLAGTTGIFDLEALAELDGVRDMKIVPQGLSQEEAAVLENHCALQGKFVQ